MTDAIRQKRRRDRLKAGLVRVEVWVPRDKVQTVRDAIAWLIAKPSVPRVKRKSAARGQRWRHENELFAAAVQMRNSGQNAVLTLSDGYISLQEWMRREAQEHGFAMSKCGTL